MPHIMTWCSDFARHACIPKIDGVCFVPERIQNGAIGGASGVRTKIWLAFMDCPQISKQWSAIPYTNRNGFSCIFCYFGIGAWFILTVWRQSSFQMPRRHTAQPHSRTEKQGTELHRPEEQHGLGNNGEIKCFFSANMLSARCCWWIHFRKLLICFS